MTAEEIEFQSAPSQAMDVEAEGSASSGESSEEKADGDLDAMDNSNEEKHEGDATNPAFSKFMQGFWDLASVDVPVRVGAAAMIVGYVSGADGDSAYAVKRLVRGMCSSRESARQGFASCLAQVLTVLPNDEPSTPAVLEKILRTTQTTSAMKGAEERELVLGRLLGLSALAMSDRLGSEPECAEGALKAVSELYTRRKWLGQAAGEAALLVVSKAFHGEGEFSHVVLPLLVPLLKGKDGSNLQVADLSPNQLLLSLGLRSIMRERSLDPQEDSTLKRALPSFLRHASVVRLGKTQDLVPTLKQSASAFPKVHSVWGRVWDDVGLSPPGQPRASLSAKRLKKLGEVWSVVVDGALTSTSLNNKGTAMLLLKQVLERVPAAGVWHVLSPGVIRLMLNHTKGEENYLYSLVHMTLEQLPKIVKDDQEVQAQVAACLLRRGTIRFDNRAGVKVVASLVKSMGQEALDAHVEFLKGVVQGKPGWADAQGSLANGDRAKEPTGDAPAQAEKEPSDDSDEIVDGSAAERLQAAEALYSLARSGGGGVNDGGNARSAALAAVGGGGIQTQGERLTKAAEFFLEMGFFAPADGATVLPPKMLELCRSKFFSLVADIAAKPLFWETGAIAAQSPKRKSGKKKSSPKDGPAAGDATGWGALEALWCLHETWQRLEAGGRKLVEGVAVGADDREACSVALAVVGRIRGGTARGEKLGAAFAGILLMVSLHLLEESKDDGRGEERCQHILDLVETYGRMSGPGKGEDEEDDEEDGEDEDEDGSNGPDPLSMLADVLVAIVAEPSIYSVRGLRDTARRVWGMVCGARPLTKSALDTLLAAVCGEDEGETAEGGDEPSSEEEEEDEAEDDDDDKEGNGHKQTENGKAGSDGSDDDSEDDGDGDEVMVDPSDVEDLLKGNDSSDEEGLQHHAGADAALGALLGLKTSGRKRGTLEAQRQGYQIRLRALDLLEVVCSRRPDSQYLLGTLLPILNAIKKLEGSARVGNRTGGEASALSKRLQTLYKGRLCKCKPRVSDEFPAAEAGAGDEQSEFASQTAQSFSDLIGLCRTWRKDGPLASLALEGALCCLRSLKGKPAKAGGGGGDALESALRALAATVGDFFGERRGGGLSIVQVEEVVKRFPDVLVPVLVNAAEGAAASDFLRTEAFHLLAGILQRRAQLDQASRKALLAHCPAIFKALGDVLSNISAQAAAAVTKAATEEQETTVENGDAAPKSKAAAASLTMLKAKRLKPLLACLSATVSADEGVGSLARMTSEVQALRRTLEAVGEASASLAMQLQCGQVAQELGVLNGGGADVDDASVADAVEGREKKKKRKDKSSPKTKRKAEQVDSPAVDGAATSVGVKGGEGKVTGSGKKKRRESKHG